MPLDPRGLAGGVAAGLRAACLAPFHALGRVALWTGLSLACACVAPVGLGYYALVCAVHETAEDRRLRAAAGELLARWARDHELTAREAERLRAAALFTEECDRAVAARGPRVVRSRGMGVWEALLAASRPRPR